MGECSICLENLFNDVTILICGHVYHTNCLKALTINADKCPMCRAKMVKLTRANFYYDQGMLKYEIINKKSCCTIL